MLLLQENQIMFAYIEALEVSLNVKTIIVLTRRERSKKNQILFAKN